jgi:Tfp pilus assembly protein PilV|tara:strand:- start:242 stop:940 length:699 start_codon:yes stop_codon:yes gene_type:complete
MSSTNLVNKNLKRFSEKGLSLLEALISTAIVGIGFMAVFQLVNFSVNSINVSGERTKINYITTMIVEDILGSRDALVGINPKTNTIAIDNYGKPVKPDGTRSTKEKFSEYLERVPWEAGETGRVCSTTKGTFIKKADIKSVYDDYKEDKGAPENKMARWDQIINQDRFIKCKNNQDIKSVKIYKICKSGTGCLIPTSDIVRDEVYIGRIQINTNGGKKRKFLYFQADYIFQE